MKVKTIGLSSIVKSEVVITVKTAKTTKMVKAKRLSAFVQTQRSMLTFYTHYKYGMLLRNVQLPIRPMVFDYHMKS